MELLFMLSVWLIFVGLCGLFLTASNLMVFLFAMEVMMLGVSLNFLISYFWMLNMSGFLGVIIVLSLITVDTAIGLALVMLYFSKRGILSVETFQFLKG